MARVFKYPLDHRPVQRLSIRLLKPLTVELIDDEPYLWCLVEDLVEPVYFDVLTVSTGENFPHHYQDEYVNTVVAKDKTVWHFFVRRM